VLLSAAASEAFAPPATPHRVHFIEQVSSFALGLFSVERRNRIAAQDIYAMCDRLDVDGVHTGSVVAAVVALKAGVNRPNQVLIGPTMSPNNAPTAIGADLELPVTQRGATTCPLPAAVGQDAHLQPEACGQAVIAESGGDKIGLHRELTPLGVMQPVVTRHAAASIIPAQRRMLIWPQWNL